MKTVRADLGKSQKNVKKCEIGGTHFLSIFWNAKKLLFELKIGQNHSACRAPGRQKVEKDGVWLLRQCCLVPGGASGRVF